jgi:type VI secretion system VasD/TssJ family lipoprotein
MNDPRSARRPSLRQTAFVLLPLAVLGACAGGPYTTALMVEGSAQLNPTFDGAPSAVNIRVFPLIDRDAFANADAEALLATPPQLPQGTWVAPHKEASVYVGKRATIDVEIKPGVRFLGVLALFNEDTGQSRQVLEVGAIDEFTLVFDRFTCVTRPREDGDDTPAPEPAPASSAGTKPAGEGGDARWATAAASSGTRA